MARKSTKAPKAPVENERVDKGGFAYLYEIEMFQNRYYSLVHSEVVRFKNKLDTLTKYVQDSNDENGLTTLAYKYTEIKEDVVSDSV